MKQILFRILLHIIRRIYPAISIVENEFKYKQIKQASSLFKKCGINFNIDYPYLINGEKFITIGDNFRARNNLRIEAISYYIDQKFNPSIIIGNNVTCESNCHISCINKIEIGNNTLIASNVLITDHFHGDSNIRYNSIAPLKRPLKSKGDIKIGNNVWIGDGVCIMPNITIGNNVIIGANSVVTTSFDDNLVIGGVPAKIIKHLS